MDLVKQKCNNKTEKNIFLLRFSSNLLEFKGNGSVNDCVSLS